MIRRIGDWLLILSTTGVSRAYAPLDGGGDPDPDPPTNGVTADSTAVTTDSTALTADQTEAA